MPGHTVRYFSATRREPGKAQPFCFSPAVYTSKSNQECFNVLVDAKPLLFRSTVHIMA